jgi:hypothetical protein
MKALDTYKKNTKLIILATVLISNIDFSIAQHIVPRRTLNFPGIPNTSTRTLPMGTQQPIIATQTQSINFGTYCVNGTTGGTITVGWDGSRTSTGNIVLLNMAPMAQPAIFEIRLLEGRTVSFTYPSTGQLTGSNGGSLTFDIGPTEHGINGSTFTVDNNPNIYIPFKVGATLYIPAHAIQGVYSGNFDIVFHAE